MSGHESANPQNPDDLQFDNAEYDKPTPAAACVVCKREIDDHYYTVNGQIICSGCRERVLTLGPPGAGFTRFLRAFLFGSAAAFAGFLIYFGILKATKYELGIIAILVGFMVGSAVRKGSRHRGGFVYQALAVFLTYTSIVASYAGQHVLPELADKVKEDRAAKNHAVAPVDPANPAAKAQPQPAKPAAKAAPEAKDPGAKAQHQPAKGDAEAPPLQAKADKPLSGVGPISGLILLLVLTVGFLYAVPVIVGFQSPIGLIIIGIALWEAWKLNRRVAIAFQGPFAVTQSTEETLQDQHPAEGEPDHAG